MEHSFSPEQLRRVLGSSEGRQLLALLSSGWASTPKLVSACAKPQTQQSRATTRGQWNSCSLS